MITGLIFSGGLCRLDRRAGGRQIHERHPAMGTMGDYFCWPGWARCWGLIMAPILGFYGGGLIYSIVVRRLGRGAAESGFRES